MGNSNLKSLDNYKYGFKDPEDYVFKSKKGLSKKVVEQISDFKNEPKWMRDFRLKSFEIFLKKKMPTWGADLSKINFQDIYYFISPAEKQSRKWKNVPKTIKDTFDRLGVPQAERKFLAGVGAQYESEVIYHNIKKSWEDKGVIFCDTDTALKKYPHLFKKYFGTVVPSSDNKLAALNSAVWSGGSFVYVPKGVKLDKPLQAYFRINAQNMGQFERTLIIADEGAEVEYVEGCTAPKYSTDSLHSAVVEIIALPSSKVRYTTVQNWSKNVYNLVTKRAFAYEDAVVEWIDGNLGSKITMKYPSVFLMGRGAKADILSIAYAGKGQHQDAGGKVMHLAPDTSSRIVSKSISAHGGRSSYRGLVKIIKGAKNSKTKVQCDALLLDERSRTDTYPTMDIKEDDVQVEHEATVAKIGEEKLFYLMSRGLSQSEAEALIIAGFVDEFTRQLPMDYAIELNRLIQMEMEGSVG